MDRLLESEDAGVGRSGTVIAPEFTSDGQLAIEVGCVVEGCSDVVAVNDFKTRAALSANVDANSALAEDDAVDLAVEEVRAVRRRRTTP